MRQRGFTLIELICVIVILGCLTSIALPRYLNLSDQAAQANVSQHAHSFAMAVQFVRMRYDLARKTGAVDNLTGFAGNNIDTNTKGYPVDTANGNNIPNNATGVNRCRAVFQGIINGPAPICGGSVACNASHDYQASTAGAETCRFTYIEDPTPPRFFMYNANDGVVTITNP